MGGYKETIKKLLKKKKKKELENYKITLLNIIEANWNSPVDISPYSTDKANENSNGITSSDNYIT